MGSQQDQLSAAAEVLHCGLTASLSGLPLAVGEPVLEGVVTALHHQAAGRGRLSLLERIHHFCRAMNAVSTRHLLTLVHVRR